MNLFLTSLGACLSQFAILRKKIKDIYARQTQKLKSLQFARIECISRNSDYFIRTEFTSSNSDFFLWLLSLQLAILFFFVPAHIKKTGHCTASELQVYI